MDVNMEYSIPKLANRLGTSRSNINQILKRSLRKVFFSFIYFDMADTAMESFGNMVDFFGLQNDEDIAELYKKLDKDIKELIESEAYSKNGKQQLTNNM